jgi:paired amphipathic helix protein Sin3a
MAIRLQSREDQTFPSPASKDEKWKYYIQTYSLIPPTEGVPHALCKKTFLSRNLPSEKQVKSVPEAEVREGMEVRICVNTYRMFFQAGTDDMILRPPRAVDAAVKEKRRTRWKEQVLPKLGWLKDSEEADVKKAQKEWDEWVGKKAKDAEGDVEMKEAA